VFGEGQGVFGIAVGPVQEELAGDLHDLTPHPVDEQEALAEAT
jgi:hypothetical protein